MSDESVCSVCSRLTGFGDEERFEPPVNLARCPAPGGLECRAVAQAVAPLRRENETLRSNSDHLSSENASLASVPGPALLVGRRRITAARSVCGQAHGHGPQHHL